VYLLTRRYVAVQAVIRAALGDAIDKPTDVAALQLHGTGTSLGDPIEVGSAAALLQQRIVDGTGYMLPGMLGPNGRSFEHLVEMVLPR